MKSLKMSTASHVYNTFTLCNVHIDFTQVTDFGIAKKKKRLICFS